MVLSKEEYDGDSLKHTLDFQTLSVLWRPLCKLKIKIACYHGYDIRDFTVQYTETLVWHHTVYSILYEQFQIICTFSQNIFQHFNRSANGYSKLCNYHYFLSPV